ncbi:MAG: tRNA 2-thiouridine(34) synthase MnmA [Candidatus Wildermuthbacteria bacterium]|nr:tRNA 2-thiouridine(34) synthase MnmA [Candidatus Wildermuthbacteria bacterium]
MQNRKRTVFVGMSGGVDSSVAASLLKRDGFNVVGIYMKCWLEAENPACTTIDDERSARMAASHLGIPFYVWNFIDEYKKRVVDYMVEGYRKGITPNPDMICNKEIKFGLFFDRAMKLGADYVATGHYARIQHTRNIPYASSAKPTALLELRFRNISRVRPVSASLPDSAMPRLSTERPCLLQGIDKNKDQSYFLAFIKPEVLNRVLFPIGNYTKPDVRELARKLGLPNSERKDSQGICFVGKVHVDDFLKRYIEPRKGRIVDMEGKVLGEHQGVMYYTIGQREGIGLSGGPWYVAAKDTEANKLVVSRNEQDLDKKETVVSHVNWISKPESFPAEATVHLRYRHKGIKANVIDKGDDSFIVEFTESQRAVTPGQFAVFYDKEEVLGAGVLQ